MPKASENEKAKMRERYRALKMAGLCPQCGQERQNPERALCTKCNAHRVAWHEKYRTKSTQLSAARRTKIREEVYKGYGGVCSCCSEHRKEFLTIDHINGGGREDRKKFRNSVSFYNWIIKNNFPIHLRLLCMNCNLSYGLYGYCPHQKESDTCTISTALPSTQR